MGETGPNAGVSAISPTHGWRLACLAGTTAVDRFYDEARLAARLQHPGIPPVHDLGVLPDGRPVMAMKLIDGKTFADLLAARQTRTSTT